MSKYEEIWDPIPQKFWDLKAMRHLLRRISFASTFEGVQEISKMSPEEAVEHLITKGEDYVAPDPIVNHRDVKKRAEEALADARKDYNDFRAKVGRDMMKMSKANRKLYDIKEKTTRNLERELDTYMDLVFAEYSVDWIRFAKKPVNSVQEKLTMFLANTLVVNLGDALGDNPMTIHQYHDGLRRNRLESYPKLIKKISIAPAMMDMLDLQENTKGNPNENFARELFELFILGEGNGYEEKDIQEAARALTGYRYDKGSLKFTFDRSEWDNTPKTVLGQTGNFTGNNIVDIAFEQPAAETHLIKKLIRDFLSPDGLPEPYVEALGKKWRENEFSLKWLFITFFASKAFHTPSFRGRIVKSPVQLYIGLLQDLGLDVWPFPRRVSQFLDLMGQSFLDPPDVEGWTGGEEWITNSTVQVRRTLIESHFLPIDKGRLSPTEKKQLYAAEGQNAGNLSVSLDRIGGVKDMDNESIIDNLIDYFLPIEVDGQFRSAVKIHMAMGGAGKAPKEERIRQSVMAILQSPYYQLS